MKLHKSLPMFATMAAALLCPLPLPAAVVYISTPKLLSIDVMCQSRDGANHTVHIVTQEVVGFQAFGIIQPIEYTFRNTATQQTVTFTKTTRDRVPSFPLPLGNYDLTIGFASESGGLRPNSAQVLYKGISVPQVVSTGGRGSGCAFGKKVSRTIS